MSQEYHEVTQPTPRVRRPIRVVFDPLDIDRSLLEQGFRGDSETGTHAILPSFASTKPSSTLFPVIIRNREALIADGFTTLEFDGRVWQLD